MLRYLLAAAALSFVPAVASAQLVTNGGFEDPTVSGPCCSTVPPDALTGWTATPNVNVVLGTYSSAGGVNLAYEGNQYLDLVGQGGTGSISQDISLAEGVVYTLTFAYSHNLFSPNSATSASAEFTIGTLTGMVSHDTGDNSDLDWQIFTGNFMATGPMSTLNFTNLTGGVNEGILLDAVSITQAVPEPATWAMMLIGFGAVGFAMRRRKPADGLLPQQA
jgi:hypothetical protein